MSAAAQAMSAAAQAMPLCAPAPARLYLGSKQQQQQRLAVSGGAHRGRHVNILGGFCECRTSGVSAMVRCDWPSRPLVNRTPLSLAHGRSQTRDLSGLSAAAGGMVVAMGFWGGKGDSLGQWLRLEDGRHLYEVQKGDTLFSIATAFVTKADVIIEANELQSDAIVPGQTLWIPRTYTIQKGDTLYAISRRFSTTVDSILEINRIDDPNLIQADDVILIP